MAAFEQKDVAVPDASKWGTYPKNVGIVAMDAYFPRQYVAQEDLEQYDGVSAGKYTLGLGQKTMAFCTDREDVYSISLSAVSRLMEGFNLSYNDIGRLEVATETILDHSKSVKTYLMTLFAASGNTDIEGIDSMNACYAGTNALFNSLAWVESSAWDGRYALVVCADIAEYEKGPARPTGGAGAVAFLVGPDAPLVVDRGVRASHMEHVYDFYKPNLDSPYPVVDGHYSQSCYLRALDSCYQRFVSKHKKMRPNEPVSLDTFDHVLFHAPYNKLVRKSFGRLAYNDFLRAPSEPQYKDLQEFLNVDTEKSYTDRALEKSFTKLSAKAYEDKVDGSTLLPTHLGNLYTGSLYVGLLSLLSQTSAKLAGKRLLMFSYGSGLAASMFSISVRGDEAAKKMLERISSISNLAARLQDRVKVEPKKFNEIMAQRESLHKVGAFQPSNAIDLMFPSSFFLVEKNDKGQRMYQQKQ